MTAAEPPRAERDALRVGLIGYGLAGAVFHAPLVATTPGLRLAAVVTGSNERRRQAEREHPGVAVVDRAERLWERAGSELDVAVVASPNATHFSLAMAALAAGLHVVVDKPFAPTSGEVRRVVDEARRRGRLAVPFHNRRWDGDLLTVQRLIADGSLGEVRRFESRFERWRPGAKPRWSTPDAHANGEGVVFDLGSHLVDQALLLFGPVREVYAELDRRHPDVRVPDDAFIALTHAAGVRSHLHTSLATPQPGPRFTVTGSGGAYVKHGLDVQEDLARRGARPTMPGWGQEPAERWGRLTSSDGTTRTVRTEPGSYRRFYEGLVAALRDGAPPPVPPEDAVAGLEIIEAAFRSAAEGTVISLSTAAAAGAASPSSQGAR